jgi:hypothetical protein
MQARLKVLHDKANVKQVKLLPVTLIGRSTECNLKIASSQVSRAHCRITLAEDTVYIEDLGSANGTFVDGKPLVAHKPTSVAPGAILAVGPAEFLIDYVASTSATMVLSHLGGAIAPHLSSTELLLPAKKALADLPVAAAANPSTSPVAIAPVAKPITTAQIAAPVIAAPVVAAVAQPILTATVPQAKPVKVQVAPVAMAIAPPTATVPEAAPVEMTFAGFAAPSDEPVRDEATQFMFGEPSVFQDSPTTVADPQPASAEVKKGGLKSLFSLFGRKAKGTIESGLPPVSAVADTGAPSVFLPTMDQVEPLTNMADSDSEPSDASAVEATEQTVLFEDPQATTPAAPGETPAGDEDGFQQFLKQL